MVEGHSDSDTDEFSEEALRELLAMEAQRADGQRKRTPETIERGRSIAIQDLAGHLRDVLTPLVRWRDLEDEWAALRSLIKDPHASSKPKADKLVEAEMERVNGDSLEAYAQFKSALADDDNAAKLDILRRLVAGETPGESSDR